MFAHNGDDDDGGGDDVEELHELQLLNLSQNLLVGVTVRMGLGLRRVLVKLFAASQ